MKRLMNLMNFDELFFGVLDSLCFVRPNLAFIARKYAFLAVGCKTNVVVPLKKWFINVHLVHRKAILERLFDRLMNLMNFDELTCCLRLFFAMGRKTGFRWKSIGGTPSSLMFIKFIGKEG